MIRTMRLTSWYRIMVVIVMWTCATLVIGCMPSGRYIEWEYIVPDGYTGFLAIRYDCPGGAPLNIVNNVARIQYEPDGTYCTSDSFVAS